MKTTDPAARRQTLRMFSNGGDHVIVVLEVVDAVGRQDVPLLMIAGSPWEDGG